VINPALTGNFTGNIRSGLHYRSQWYTVNAPYVTSMIWADGKVFEERFHGDYAGIGLYIANDRSGAASLNYLQMMTSGSYHKFIGPDKKNKLSAGIQIGFFQKSLDPSKTTFANQYLNGTFDTGIPSGENISDFSISNFDMQAGLAYTHQMNEQLSVEGGLSAYHLNRPDQSLTGIQDALSRRYVFHVSSEIAQSSDLNIKPSLLYMSQNEASQMNVTLLAEKKLTFDNHYSYTLLASAGTRLGDSYFLGAGIRYGKWQGMATYDFNTSELVQATNYQGAFEFSIIYTDRLVPGSRSIPSRRACPRM
jgi:type IX secretion system PorP/SprF family membrane protein